MGEMTHGTVLDPIAQLTCQQLTRSTMHTSVLVGMPVHRHYTHMFAHCTHKRACKTTPIRNTCGPCMLTACGPTLCCMGKPLATQTRLPCHAITLLLATYRASYLLVWRATSHPLPSHIPFR